MSDIVLSASVRQNLLSLQATADLLATTQTRLATGKKVNSALDNPTNFFTAQSLDSRANDINALLDGVGNGVQILQAANTGITSLQKLIDTAKSVANQALQTPVGYSQKSSVTSVAIPGATADNLLGTPGAPVDATYAGGAADITNTTAYGNTALTAGGTALQVGSAGANADSSTKLNELTDGAGVSKAPAVGDSFTVNGKKITFAVNGAPSQDASGNWTIGLDQSIGKLLNTVDSITGNTTNPSTITAGVITLNTGTSDDLNIVDTTGTTPLADALGFVAADFTTPTTRTGGLLSAGTLSGTTKLSVPLSGGDNATGGSLTDGFKVGDTLQINGTDAAHTLTFVKGPANNANEISIDDNVNTLLAKIDGLSGGTGSNVAPAVAGPPAVPAHVEIHTGVGSDLKIVTSNVAAAQALGLTGTPAPATTAPGPTTGQVFVTTMARAPGAPPQLEGKTLTIAATAGGTPLNIIFGAGGSGAGQVKDLYELNAVLATNNLQASLSTDGKLTITTSNDAASFTIGALGGTAAAAGDIFGGAVPTGVLADPDSQATRANFVTQYNNIIDQIRTTAQDASFNGVNLLQGDQLKLVFNETGTSTLNINGVALDPPGLGLGALTIGTDFIDNKSTQKIIQSLQTASTYLRSQASTLGSNLSIVQLRQDFSKNLINVLQTGSSNLTIADTNEEAANSQALSTRQSIAVSALALANQSQQSVLQLLR
ncbi:flagellin [Bradyrhizobium sp. SYSU BS000235]|uniref:flagellin N-terminal helical domain-containing protein n=1 Tax=Bradyrhizobium sp. SYSU BS000235 TaxID=3411332 RepID=UPI003C7293C3